MQAELAVLAQRVEAMREDFEGRQPHSTQQVHALLDAAACSADIWTVMVERLGLRPLD